MRVKWLLALGAAAIALLVVPGVASAQTDGVAADPAAQAEPPAAPDPGPATAPDSGSAPAEPVSADTVASAPVTDSTSSGDEAAQPTTSQASSDPAATSSSSSAETADQAQAQVETASSSNMTATGTAKTRSGGCRLARAAAGVGPPCTGGSRTGRGQISTDPANPTALPPVNGVTVGIWITTLPNGDEVLNYRVLNGTFTGTNAIDLKVKNAGPSPIVITCQVTNAAPTGVCPVAVNPNSGKAHVDFVDGCPGTTTAPPVNPPTGGSGGVAGAVGKGGQNGQSGNQSGPNANVKGNVGSTPTGPSVAAAAVGLAPGTSGGLPVTGLSALWLILIGGGLLTGGAVLRTRTE